jgi:hypothetical protein
MQIFEQRTGLLHIARHDHRTRIYTALFPEEWTDLAMDECTRAAFAIAHDFDAAELMAPSEVGVQSPDEIGVFNMRRKAGRRQALS